MIKKYSKVPIEEVSLSLQILENLELLKTLYPNNIINSLKIVADIYFDTVTNFYLIKDFQIIYEAIIPNTNTIDQKYYYFGNQLNYIASNIHSGIILQIFNFNHFSVAHPLHITDDIFNAEINTALNRNFNQQDFLLYLGVNINNLLAQTVHQSTIVNTPGFNPNGYAPDFNDNPYDTFNDSVHEEELLPYEKLSNEDIINPLDFKNYWDVKYKIDNYNKKLEQYKNTKIPKDHQIVSNNNITHQHKDYVKIDFITNLPIAINVSQVSVFYDEDFLLGKKKEPSYTVFNLKTNPCLLCIIINNIYGFTSIENLNKDWFKNTFVEDFYDGIFYHKDDLKIKFKKAARINGIKYELNKYFSFKRKVKNKPITYIKTLGQKYTYGLELETISGLIPEYFTNFIAFESVHDGSLRDPGDNNAYGKEYVTDVLYGDLGLLEIKKLCNVIKERCLINKQCSVHYHIGNVNFNKENILLLYYISWCLEAEIFKLLPKSRRDNEYCRLLNDQAFCFKEIELFNTNERKYIIDKNYNSLISILSKKDVANKYINKKEDHPAGYKCGYNHSAERYCWVNFIPAVFNTRNNGIYTIEFRCLNGTNDYREVKNFLLIFMAIVSFVENHKQLIYEISKKKNYRFDLESIITTVYPKNYRHLLAFINERKKTFEFGLGTKEDDIEKEFYKNINLESELKDEKFNILSL